MLASFNLQRSNTESFSLTMYSPALLVTLCAAIALLAGAAATRGCAPLSAQLPQPSDLPIITTLPDPFTFRLSDRRVQSRADWECRREELKTLVNNINSSPEEFIAHIRR